MLHVMMKGIGDLCSRMMPWERVVIVMRGLACCCALILVTCIPADPTAYFFCILHLLEALSNFRAELPAETGT
jgi:hypothetical protein